MSWDNVKRCTKCGAGCPEEASVCVRCGGTQLGPAELPFQPRIPETTYPRLTEADGADAAGIDLTAGILRYKWTGSAGPAGKDFCRLVDQRLGMVVDDFAICFVDESKVAFARGYNRAVRDHIIAKYGRNLVAEALEEAQELHLKRYEAYLRAKEASEDGSSASNAPQPHPPGVADRRNMTQ